VKIAAYQHGPATSPPETFTSTSRMRPTARREQQHTPALTVTALAIDQPGSSRVPCGFNPHFAAGSPLASIRLAASSVMSESAVTCTLPPAPLAAVTSIIPCTAIAALVRRNAYRSAAETACLPPNWPHPTSHQQRHSLNSAAAQPAARVQLPGSPVPRSLQRSPQSDRQSRLCHWRYRRRHADRTRTRDERDTAALAAIGAYARRWCDRDGDGRRDADASTLALYAVRLYRAGDGCRTFIGSNRNRPTLRPGRLGLAARGQRDVLFRLEKDLAVLADHHAVREIRPLCLIAPAKMPMLPASAIILPTLIAVFSGAVSSTRSSGFLRIDQFYAFARGEDDLALGAVDNAVVLDVGRDEIDETSTRGGNGAVVDHLA